MNGTTSDEIIKKNKQKIFPAEKEKIVKRRVIIKLVFTIIISNSLVYTLFTTLNNKPKNCKDVTFTKTHLDFSKIVLPATILTYIIPGKKEYKISIYNNLNKQIIETAYFHPYDIQSNSCNDSGKTLFTVEIPTKLLSSIKPLSESYFLYPFHKKKPLTNKENIRYELIL
jgi:hypothetical protein